MAQMTENATLSLAGRSLRWRFPGGPTGDTTYEHVFSSDGTVVWRDVKEAAYAGTAREPKPRSATKERGSTERKAGAPYASFEVGHGVHLVSYLADSGYTLTVVVNLNNGAVHGFASNEKEWHPLIGELQP